MASYEEIKEAIAANDYATAKTLYDETTDLALRNRLSGERRQEIEEVLARMEASQRDAKGRFRRKAANA